MPKPKGETHHSASITEATAKKLKRKLASGEPVSKVARDTKVAYQTVYRLARGETWADVEPKGAVLDKDAKAARGPRRRMKLDAWYDMWRKRRAGTSASRLAKANKISQGSVRRLLGEFELMMATRVAQLQLTSGSYEPAKRKYGIRRSDAERLDRLATANKLPTRLQRIVDEGFPELERQLAKEDSDG